MLTSCHALRSHGRFHSRFRIASFKSARGKLTIVQTLAHYETYRTVVP
jgi:hypothetical protein